jgi:RNA polymerase sigma-70 factor (ECF subfamily)
MSTDVDQSFAAERSYLFAIAYRMTGSASEADDILQEAWLRARASNEAPRNARAFFSTIVVRLCLDASKSARARREAYVGPWLPEPILGIAAPGIPIDDRHPDDRVGARESVSMALLVVLSRLSALERAVFLLREVFDYEFDEIAACLDKTEAACRQLFHRARQHVVGGRARYEPSEADARRLIGGFLDGGGRVKAALKPVYGPERSARFFIGVTRKGGAEGVTLELATINGEHGVLLRKDGAVVNAIVFQMDGSSIHRVHLVSNPEKLAHLNGAVALSSSTSGS